MAKKPKKMSKDLEKRAKLKFALEGNHGKSGATFKKEGAKNIGDKLYQVG